jgi:hypothetical protein
MLAFYGPTAPFFLQSDIVDNKTGGYKAVADCAAEGYVTNVPAQYRFFAKVADLPKQGPPIYVQGTAGAPPQDSVWQSRVNPGCSAGSRAAVAVAGCGLIHGACAGPVEIKWVEVTQFFGPDGTENGQQVQQESTLLYVLSHTTPHTNLHIDKNTEA